MALSIQRLSQAHDRAGFDCGSEPLNRYLKETSRQHGERGISRTFVLVDAESQQPHPILGFYTLSLCQISGEEIPAAILKRLPRSVGGVKLGRLAIAKDQQRRGFGKVLLAGAFVAIRKTHRIPGLGRVKDGQRAVAAERAARIGCRNELALSNIRDVMLHKMHDRACVRWEAQALLH